jgi:hypothetical protein
MLISDGLACADELLFARDGNHAECSESLPLTRLGSGLQARYNPIYPQGHARFGAEFTSAERIASSERGCLHDLVYKPRQSLARAPHL